MVGDRNDVEAKLQRLTDDQRRDHLHAAQGESTVMNMQFGADTLSLDSAYIMPG